MPAVPTPWPINCIVWVNSFDLSSNDTSLSKKRDSKDAQVSRILTNLSICEVKGIEVESSMRRFSNNSK